MSSSIRIVKREEREVANAARAAGAAPPVQADTAAMVRTVKSWITAAHDRRRAETDYALSLLRGVQHCLTILLAIGLFSLFAQCAVHAQETAPAAGETLTLDQAIDLALRQNHSVKIAQLAVARADEDIAAAKTSRLPLLRTHVHVSGNLAKNELNVPNPATNLFPGLGDFFTLNVDRKPTAIFAVSAMQPLTQQYRIGLHIKQARLAREATQAKLRQQENETIDRVKKAYYSILQTQSALVSVQEAVKSYQELDKVTGDYVVQQVALKADHLVVQTRLAQVQYEKLELSNRLATQKEQFNSLLGRELGADV